MAQRNLQLDGLRGWAALTVAVDHTLFGIKPSLIEDVFRPTLQSLDTVDKIAVKLVLILFPGDVAVTLFFVLSGTVLFRSLMRDNRSAGAATPIFVIRRILRIYPALLISLLICFAAFVTIGLPLTWHDLARNLVLFDFPVNGATWTLNVEFVAVPFMLLAYAGYRRGGEAGMIVVFLMFWALSGLSFLKPHPEMAREFMLAFAIGAMIPTEWGRRFVERIPVWIIPVAIVLMLLARHVIEGRKTGMNVQFAGAGLLVAMLYYGRGEALCRFLRNTVSQFLGRISYSFYLYHTLFQVMICHYLSQKDWAVANPLAVGLPAAMLVAICTIPVAFVSAVLIEERFTQLARRTTKTSRPSSQAV